MPKAAQTGIKIRVRADYADAESEVKYCTCCAVQTPSLHQRGRTKIKIHIDPALTNAARFARHTTLPIDSYVDAAVLQPPLPCRRTRAWAYPHA